MLVREAAGRVLLLLLLGLSAQGGDPVHYIREHAGGERRSLCTTHASCDPSQFCESVVFFGRYASTTTLGSATCFSARLSRGVGA